VLELRDKLPELRSELELETAAVEPSSTLKTDLISALVNLGYRRKDAERAAENTVKEKGVEVDFAEALKFALGDLLS